MLKELNKIIKEKFNLTQNHEKIDSLFTNSNDAIINLDSNCNNEYGVRSDNSTNFCKHTLPINNSNMHDNNDYNMLKRNHNNDNNDNSFGDSRPHRFRKKLVNYLKHKIELSFIF
eukprot:Pgem_evm1s14897